VSTDPAATPGEPTAPSTATVPQPDWAKFTRQAAVIAIGGLAIYLGAGFANLWKAEGPHAKEIAEKRFGMAYLAGFIYWFSIPLGGMALLMIGYLAKSSWGLLLRRPMEAAIRTLPLWILLFIPIVVFASSEHYSPYFWTAPWNEDYPKGPGSVMPDASMDKRNQTIQAGEYMIRRAVLHETELRQKGNFGFLTKIAFVLVGIALFAIWGTMIYFLSKWGKDASDETNTAKVDHALHRLGQLSGPGIIIYALTITAAATQWVMSMQAGWASTMFPVIFAVNQFLTCFAFCLAMFLLFVSQPPLKHLMRDKFQLDMGTLLLAFTLFWSYTSFSQFMLVWIGNLPEEIPFFLKRSMPTYGFWWWVSAALIAFHFALPFLLLLFRDIKRHPVRLRFVATYLLVICAIDVVWWIEPTQPSVGRFPFWILMDLGAILGIGGLFGLVWIWHLKQRPLIPASQVFLLPEGHHHEHH
jgi:hypothetical protein